MLLDVTLGDSIRAFACTRLSELLFEWWPVMQVQLHFLGHLLHKESHKKCCDLEWLHILQGPHCLSWWWIIQQNLLTNCSTRTGDFICCKKLLNNFNPLQVPFKLPLRCLSWPIVSCARKVMGQPMALLWSPRIACRRHWPFAALGATPCSLWRLMSRWRWKKGESVNWWRVRHWLTCNH